MKMMKLSRLVALAVFSIALLHASALAQDHKPAASRFFPVKVEGKWGFIDPSGDLRVPAQYSGLDEFGELSVEGTAVAIAQLWGFINTKGEWVLGPRFHLAENCVNHFAAVEMDDGKWHFINRDGSSGDGARYDRVTCFVDGPPAVVLEGDNAWTYLDVEHNRLLPVRTNIPQGFDEGLTPMKAGSIWGFVDESGTFVIPPKFDEARGFSEGLAAVRVGNLWGYADKSGAIVISPQFGWAYAFEQGLAGVQFEGKYGFISREGKFVVPPTFQDVRPFSEDLAAIESNSKWGYVDRQGNVVIEPQFGNNALPFRAGIAQVRLWNGDLGYINKSGEYIWKPQQ
jgi:WG containing repeat